MKHNDRLVPLVYIAFGPLAILTAIFGPILVFFPDSTRDYWAWEITPAMSTIWVGAGYTFGAIAIITMLRVGRWRTAIIPIIATWTFSIIILAATLLFLSRFFLDTPNFYVWFIIYLALPFVLPVIWWLNRERDPESQPNDMLVPNSVIGPAGIAGGIIGLLSLVMVFSPSTAATFWPWRLTPLMSLIIGAWLLFIATALLCLLLERRYIAYRYYLMPAAIWFAIIFFASIFHLDNFDFGRASAWLWFVVIAGASLTLLGLYIYLERLSRAWGR